jgi:hypothetical protein
LGTRRLKSSAQVPSSPVRVEMDIGEIARDCAPGAWNGQTEFLEPLGSHEK